MNYATLIINGERAPFPRYIRIFEEEIDKKPKGTSKQQNKRSQY